MGNREHFWRLEHLSDRQLLERLHGVLHTQRCALAELVAHLGEVEERRLHLAAAHGSMFSYCVQHLGMSEDEACRRIDLARLARRFPLLFGELGSGRISLSVALLLKPVLTPNNHAELLAAVRGASLRTAREMLAARFPSPDVPSRIRKLPERIVAPAMPAAGVGVGDTIPTASSGAANAVPVVADLARAMPAAAVTADAMPVTVASVVPARVATPGGTTGTTTGPARTFSTQPPQSLEQELGLVAGIHAQSSIQDPLPPAPSGLPNRASACQRIDRQRIEPLSAGRYRIQFTADAGLKQKLELARDLLRHSLPSGDLAPVVSRALDLLLQELLQRRFGARRKDTPRRSARPAPREEPTVTTPPVAVPAPVSPVTWSAVAPLSAINPSAVAPPVALPSAPSPAPVTRAARRAVLERDGLGCCWVGATGKRCGSTAWLQLDHQHPSGKGGGSEPENLRLLCRAHNRFSAELAYGREHVERAIQARQHAAGIRATRIPAAPRDAAQ